MQILKNMLGHSLHMLAAIPAGALRCSRRYASLAEITHLDRPRVLIIACHWIGDTLWAAQIAPHLRRFWPGAFLCALTKPVAEQIWSGNLAVDQVITSKAVTSDRHREQHSWKNLYQLASALAKDSWDLAIDLTGNRYSALFCHWLKARHTLGFAGGEFGALYATYVQNAERPGVHLAERPFRVIEPLLANFAYNGQVLPFQPVLRYEYTCQELGFDIKKALAVIAPGAGWKEKRWPLKNFAHVVETLGQNGWQVLLTGSRPEESLSQEIMSSISPGSQKAVKTLHEATPGKLFSLLSGCSVFWGNDSGLGHVAAALGRKTIVVFSQATLPEICAPLGQNVIVLHSDNEIAVQPDEVATHINIGI